MRKIMVEDECLLWNDMSFDDVQMFIDTYVWPELKERKSEWQTTNILRDLDKATTATALGFYLELYNFKVSPIVIAVRKPKNEILRKRR